MTSDVYHLRTNVAVARAWTARNVIGPEMARAKKMRSPFGGRLFVLRAREPNM